MAKFSNAFAELMATKRSEQQKKEDQEKAITAATARVVAAAEKWRDDCLDADNTERTLIDAVDALRKARAQ